MVGRRFIHSSFVDSLPDLSLRGDHGLSGQAQMHGILWQAQPQVEGVKCQQEQALLLAARGAGSRHRHRHALASH